PCYPSSSLVSTSLSCCFFHHPRHHRALHSFPTRRSSDLTVADAHFREKILRLGGILLDLPADIGHVHPEDLVVAAGPGAPQLLRSEEHTSELQSRFDLVCRLLLEKKKKNTGGTHHELSVT